MTVPLHTTQFFGGRVTGAGPTTLYTVPAGYRAVLRDVNIMNQAGATKTFSLAVSATFGLFTFSVPSGIVAGNPKEWSGWLVISAGQFLNYSGSTGSTWDLLLGGYLYPVTL